ncbi:MAG: NADPH-dependent F420 reductase [Jiangellaceae bacterium]
MRIAVLGTGAVGWAIASRLVEVGHEVRMGSRTAGNPATLDWLRHVGGSASAGTFADAASFGEVVFNCTAGAHSLEALHAAGADGLAGKLLVDVSNALDHAGEGLPRLFVSNTDSLGEQIQRAFPEARVVKALNTMNCDVMVNPALVPGDHAVFVCGDHAGAKADAAALLDQFGWPAERIIDLGDITAACGTEMYMPLWLRLWTAAGGAHFNIAIAR